VELQNLRNVLARKVGPYTVGTWLIVGAGGVGLAFAIRGFQGRRSTPTGDVIPATGQLGELPPVGSVPYQQPTAGATYPGLGPDFIFEGDIIVTIPTVSPPDESDEIETIGPGRRRRRQRFEPAPPSYVSDPRTGEIIGQTHDVLGPPGGVGPFPAGLDSPAHRAGVPTGATQ